jgi:hypothetical protein
MVSISGRFASEPGEQSAFRSRRHIGMIDREDREVTHPKCRPEGFGRPRWIIVSPPHVLPVRLYSLVCGRGSAGSGRVVQTYPFAHFGPIRRLSLLGSLCGHSGRRPIAAGSCQQESFHFALLPAAIWRNLSR